MPSEDDDERAIETQRLVSELADVRKRMQLRAEQPPLRSGGSGAYRAVPFAIAAKTPETKDSVAPAERPRTAPPPAAAPIPVEEYEPAPPTRRRPG